MACSFLAACVQEKDVLFVSLIIAYDQEGM
jgi:hypothetical protein